MTKRYSILQKKLQELESELNCVFSLAAQTQSTPCPDAVLEDIHQKFVFVSNLLSAELASAPSKPHHLYHIARRLSELERAFLGWDGFKTSALNFDDNASTCSCSTESSCLNEDGEASDGLCSPVYYEDDPERFSQGLHEEKALVEFDGGLNHDNQLKAELLDCLVEKRAKEGIVGVELIEKDVKGIQKKVGIGRFCGAMAGGVLVLGMALMGYAMGRFYGCFYYVERPGCFLNPT